MTYQEPIYYVHEGTEYRRDRDGLLIVKPDGTTKRFSRFDLEDMQDFLDVSSVTPGETETEREKRKIADIIVGDFSEWHGYSKEIMEKHSVSADQIMAFLPKYIYDLLID